MPGALLPRRPTPGRYFFWPLNACHAASMGVVEDFYQSDKIGGQKKIYLIQDAHTNESCQINISKIIEWFSDFLCRGVTGEGDMKRSLYTDDDEFIHSFYRAK